MRRGVIGGGNFIVDHVKTVDAYPAEQTLANILAQTSGGGGGAYNVLKDLATLDSAMPLEAVGLVGDDAAGRAILHDCEVSGIEVASLRPIGGASTSYTDVFVVESTGR